MACLLAIDPKLSKRGVVSFTTQEEIYIRNNADLLEKVNALKTKFKIGLHFNWHNQNYNEDDLFDFLLAGEEDLRTPFGRPVETLNIDACNFTPSCFGDFRKCEKHWDLLYVARAVFFKGIEEFFKQVKKVYLNGHKIRVLFLCPVPSESSKVAKELRELYEETFSIEERRLFNFLLLWDDYPFFFDLETLSVFYRSSKVFVHSAPDERRCRVAAYAYSSGLPVVSFSSVSSILPIDLRQKPYAYVANSYEEFPALIVEAINNYNYNGEIEPAKFLSERYTVERLKKVISPELNYFTDNLDIRLGRHHGFGDNTNSVNQTISGFCDDLLSLSVENIEKYLFQSRGDVEKKYLGSLWKTSIGSKNSHRLYYRFRQLLSRFKSAFVRFVSKKILRR